jgi:hypothetical protein
MLRVTVSMLSRSSPHHRHIRFTLMKFIKETFVTEQSSSKANGCSVSPIPLKLLLLLLLWFYSSLLDLGHFLMFLTPIHNW